VNISIVESGCVLFIKTVLEVLTTYTVPIL